MATKRGDLTLILENVFAKSKKKKEASAIVNESEIHEKLVAQELSLKKGDSAPIDRQISVEDNRYFRKNKKTDEDKVDQKANDLSLILKNILEKGKQKNEAAASAQAADIQVSQKANDLSLILKNILEKGKHKCEATASTQEAVIQEIAVNRHKRKLSTDELDIDNKDPPQSSKKSSKRVKRS